jgi:hypothetical protein
MAVPSYALPTTSSIVKATPRPSKTQEPALSPSPNPKLTPKTLKRPSTLTPHRRQTLAYNADLHPITPKDGSKPCPFTELPSELRTAIYTYIFAPLMYEISGTTRLTTPPILATCRAIRIEAAYTYYTTQPFSFSIRNLNFTHIQAWVMRLTPDHRALLTLNKRLTIYVETGLKHSYTYPPHGWLLDDTLHAQWKACAEFGNLYKVQTNYRRLRFVQYARMRVWFRFAAKAPAPGVTDRKITWHYDFGGRSEALAKFLRFEIYVFSWKFVEDMWPGSAGLGRRMIKGVVLRFLEELEEAFGRVGEQRGTTEIEDAWEGNMRDLKGAVEKW